MASPGPEPAPPSELPQPDPSDSEEVARALKLAQTLWDEGQKREAVRTLQRGAAQAEEDGNDLRALALARSAADLSAELPDSIPPTLAADPETIIIDVDEDPPTLQEPLPSAPASAPVETATGAAAPASVSSPISTLPGTRASSLVPRPATTTNGVPAFVVPVEAREVRVSVKRSALDEGLFVVRPLAPGAKAPAGSREALLVFSDKDPE